MNRLIWTIILISAHSVPLALASADATVSLDSLKKQYLELREDTWTEKRRFDERYELELERIINSASDAANLELVLAARREKEEFRDKGLSSELSDHEVLAKAQTIYRENVKKLLIKQRESQDSLDSGYIESLVKLRDELTRARKFDDATKVQAEITQIEKQRENALPLSGDGTTDLKALLTSRKWIRHIRIGKHEFTFHSSGKLSTEDIKSTWNRFKISGGVLTVYEGEKRELEFTVSSKNPYTLSCRTEGATHMKFVEKR